MSNGYISFNSNDLETNDRYKNFNLNTRNIKRWGASKAQFINRTPNITPYNNKLAVSDGLVSYPVTIQTGQYDIDSFASAIESAINLQAFLGFSVVVNTDNTIDIQNVGTPFYFSEINEVNKDLATMAGWTLNSNLVNSLTGTPLLIYSSYVDIISFDLNQTNISDDYSSNDSTRSIIERVYIDSGNIPAIYTQSNENIKMMTVSGELYCGNVTIQLKDEWGNEYYNPDNLSKYNLLLLTE